jgi:hypothetical protein
MTVKVSRVDYSGGSVAVGHGVDEAGNLVRFAGDWRPMVAIAEALAEEGEVEADVPEWAFI